MKYLGISGVLVLDAVGRPLAGAELTPAPALIPLSEGMSQLMRSLAVPVLSDPTSRTVVRTYRELDGQLYMVSIAAVRSQFETGVSPSGALAVARRFDKAELARFSNIIMYPVRLGFDEDAFAQTVASQLSGNVSTATVRTPVVDHEGRTVAHLSLDLSRDLHRAGRSLSLVSALQVAFAGLVMGSALVLMLNRLVLGRVRRLQEELSEIGREGPTCDKKLAVRGHDELTRLTGDVNDLLDRTRGHAQQQRQAFQRQEALQLQLLQSQKTEALGRFTGGIAHDFNNSLAAISGWVRLAKEDLPANHPSDASLDQALKSIRYASGLMKQLLSFSRQSAPRMEKLRVCSIVEEARSLVGLGLMGHCTLDVECRTQNDWILADPTQMKQVMVNLLINACDAMNGAGVISLLLEDQVSGGVPGVQAHPVLDQLPAGRYVTISVRDQGPGISAEHLERIFDPFFTTKAAGKGTGLGLSVVHGVLARHGGAISVTSTAGEGACFVLALPSLAGPSGTVDALDDAAWDASGRLLYAEDDPSVREAWCALLELQGWTVVCARDGEEAWDLFQANNGRWDVVLTDQSMPRLSGLELACRIAATDAPPPLVLMSGQTSIEEEAHLKQAGFSAVLHKPVDEEELMAVLRTVITSHIPVAR